MSVCEWLVRDLITGKPCKLMLCERSFLPSLVPSDGSVLCVNYSRLLLENKLAFYALSLYCLRSIFAPTLASNVFKFSSSIANKLLLCRFCDSLFYISVLKARKFLNSLKSLELHLRELGSLRQISRSYYEWSLMLLSTKSVCSDSNDELLQFWGISAILLTIAFGIEL